MTAIKDKSKGCQASFYVPRQVIASLIQLVSFISEEEEEGEESNWVSPS